jgi:hypothetical protein
MVLIGLIGVCVGAFLAQVFCAFILVPATFMAVVSLAAAELISRQILVHAVLADVGAAWVIQVGYLLGCFARPPLHWKRLHRPFEINS